MPSVHQCGQCPRLFSARSQLNRHLKVHDASDWFGCSHCPYRSPQKSNLMTHVRAKHNGEKPYSCDLCDIRFGDRSALNRHTKSKHRKGTPQDHASAYTVPFQQIVKEPPPSRIKVTADPHTFGRTSNIVGCTAVPLCLDTARPCSTSAQDFMLPSAHPSADGGSLPDLTWADMTGERAMLNSSLAPFCSSHATEQQALPFLNLSSPDEMAASAEVRTDAVPGTGLPHDYEELFQTELLFPDYPSEWRDSPIQAVSSRSPSHVRTAVRPPSTMHAYTPQSSLVPGSCEQFGGSVSQLPMNHSMGRVEGCFIGVPHVNSRRQSQFTSINEQYENTAMRIPCVPKPLTMSTHEDSASMHEATQLNIATEFNFALEAVTNTNEVRQDSSSLFSTSKNVDTSQPSAGTVHGNTFLPSNVFTDDDCSQLWGPPPETTGFVSSDYTPTSPHTAIRHFRNTLETSSGSRGFSTEENP